ncbi:MAG: tRNA (cytidine(34)-2'-O)-methyltransferase [Neomegalonema sp.]|nr:tRNA (cytidine(34)-2'-O)-methyltransferase [Neomegalonema sp.]
MRSCACFGAGMDVIEPCGFAFSPAALRRSAMDYADLVDIRRHDDWHAFERQLPGRLVLLTTKAASPLWDHCFAQTDTVMVGQESCGVPDFVQERAESRVMIRMAPGARSLNVATSAGIALAEAQRQGVL